MSAPANGHKPQEEVHFRTCTVCEAMCGLQIRHAGGEVLSIRGDEQDEFSRGHI